MEEQTIWSTICDAGHMCFAGTVAIYGLLIILGMARLTDAVPKHHPLNRNTGIPLLILGTAILTRTVIEHMAPQWLWCVYGPVHLTLLVVAPVVLYRANVAIHKYKQRDGIPGDPHEGGNMHTDKGETE
jgi:hypothetical protein